MAGGVAALSRSETRFRAVSWDSAARSERRRKWTFTDKRRPGRPRTRQPVKALIVRMARVNPTWGHRRIQGELARQGYTIAASTVWEILHTAGIDPAPRWAGPTWR
ncbi:helix-turn-helix domain-containing protein [Nonomuraea sp. NPDC046570]|uniref:helix-turn-helix domain-containing protein n=1 Tax=Nonomuraea sp. NPDC046570 TaxID=3155255 RepID=UPI0033F506B3